MQFKNQLSVVAIVKNEGPYIREWIEHHINIGATNFYIYDNESKDDTKTILKQFARKGIVVYNHIPGRGIQLVAYNDALNRYKMDTKYMGFIDVDEFIMPCKIGENVPSLLDDFMLGNPFAGGIGINWRVNGSSGFKKKERSPRNGEISVPSQE